LLFSYSTLVDTSNNTLSGNVMVGNQHNFDVEGPALSDFQQSVDTSNLVDGKPVYYFMNKSDIVVNADAYPEVGYLGFVNCHNVTVQGLNLTKNGQGLLLVSTNGSKIIGNNVENNYDGISLYSSSNSVLSGNNITANDYDGILLSSSSNNTLSGNNVTDSLEYGIGLYSSSNNNVLSGNNVNANQYFGISLESSSFNRIYHNNIDNGIWTALVYDSNNTWDDGFPSGGNYWSDYSMKYPNAIEVGSSGIWNTPYVIDASNVDHYPLVNQTALPLSTLWDPSRDSYGQGNYASSWSAGNCYGLSSTEILYFMHYVLGDMTYPYFPAQNPPANTTSQLNLPILNDETWTTLNNALLAVMFHQVYDPNHFFNSPSSESAECNKLVVALASGTPALLTMHGVNSTGNDIYHAIVAYGVETLPNGTVSIEVSDPNVLQTQVEVAYYDPTTQAFSYSDSAAGFSFDKFEVVTPEMIQTSWQSLWLYELTQPSWWFGNWLNCSVVGYNMVIADKMVTVDSNSLQDYFTVAGDSQTFVCGIPGSSGIEEGNTQVYAIPEGTSFTVSDPTSDQSAMLIDHVENESGQLVGYGYFLNVTTTQGFLNFTVTPSNSGLLLTSGTSAFNLSATIFYATLQNHSVYQVSNVSIDAMQTANFTVNNWQMLNDTSPSPVTLIITPEFPLAIILPLFMIATLLAALMFRRKRPEKSGKPDSLIGACQN
jgi:parallel beta-helix repeat protein